MSTLARNATPKTQPQVVVVPAFQHGKQDVVAIRKDDELRLSLSDFGPTITIKSDAPRERCEGQETYQIVCTVDENDELVGWKIEKSGVTAMDDTTVYITAKKQRASRSNGGTK